ncbi:protein SENESCENCE-ASSOCIATED GENE 21, mitochondrial-like [Cucurbita moschata]|uniref:Protein SENESCENCE-ASSOCIATED GENE 21, mitochondrial-like n=1 Tax=Cucurbita moschata TaxID=3662 RepID=A0A6J1F2C1_CUCMO|nr:protein SENESCENCE-ASSOCIATED GENE 21, mitochondrial-like [Cucurbita moschata]
MARFFSGVKIISGLVSDGLSEALIRRGYTAEAMAASKRAARDDGMMKKGEQAERSREKVAWVPDPVTGYYRPENYSDEIDAVDLRAMMLQPRRKFIEQNE